MWCATCDGFGGLYSMKSVFWASFVPFGAFLEWNCIPALLDVHKLLLGHAIRMATAFAWLHSLA